jgi:hypothetical protein
MAEVGGLGENQHFELRAGLHKGDKTETSNQKNDRDG